MGFLYQLELSSLYKEYFGKLWIKIKSLTSNNHPIRPMHLSHLNNEFSNMAFVKRSKSRKTVTFDLPEEECAEFDHGGNENQSGKEKIEGKNKGGFIRRLKKLISKRRECAPKESRRYDEHESRRCDNDDDNNSSVLDSNHEDDDSDNNSSVIDLHDDNDKDSSVLDLYDEEDKDSSAPDLHSDDDEDDDDSEDLHKMAQHDHTSLTHRGGENANQMSSPGNSYAYPASYNTHMYPANNMYAYPGYNSAYHTYAYPSYNPDYNMHTYSAYNANAYPAYNLSSKFGAMHEYPTNNMNMPSNSVPPLDHTFNYFTEENPACTIM